MVSFENFEKSMLPSLSELKVTPSFCFPIKIRDDRTASNRHVQIGLTMFKLREIRLGVNISEKPISCSPYPSTNSESMNTEFS